MSADATERRKRRREKRRQELNRKNRRRKGLRWAAVLVLTLGFAVLAWQQSDRGLSSSQAQPTSLLPAPMPSAAITKASATDTRSAANQAGSNGTEPPAAADPQQAVQSAVARLQESVDTLAQKDKARVALLEQERTRLLQEKRRADEAKRKTDGLAAASASAASTRSADVEAAAVSAARAPEPAVQKAPEALAVDQVCAGGNLLTRDLCRIRECGKAGNVIDPVCVRFRQMDEARRQEAEVR